MSYDPKLIYEAGLFWAEELDGQPDCKTATRIIRKKLTTYALQCENAGYEVVRPPKFLHVLECAVAGLVFLGFVFTFFNWVF